MSANPLRLSRRPLGLSLALLALFACSAPVDDAPRTASSARPLISDQLHHGGTTGFFFLPPITTWPTTSGVFSKHATPTVEIRELDASGGLGRTVAVFTTTSGPGGQLVRVIDAQQRYVVDWDTRQFTLSTSTIHRIRVLVPGRELGFADVRFVGSVAEVGGVDRSEYVPMIDGYTLPIAFRIERSAVDRDLDGVLDWADNCVLVPNAAQADADGDGVGDACACGSCDDGSPCTLDACTSAGCTHTAVADGPVLAYAPTTCGTGACASSGLMVCASGALVDTCQPGAPAASDATCDGLDEDCDGAIDEDYVALGTSCGVGACTATGGTSCVAGGVVDSCTATSPRAAGDYACDGVDDDCDGATDEDGRCEVPGGAPSFDRTEGFMRLQLVYDGSTDVAAGGQSCASFGGAWGCAYAFPAAATYDYVSLGFFAACEPADIAPLASPTTPLAPDDANDLRRDQIVLSADTGATMGFFGAQTIAASLSGSVTYCIPAYRGDVDFHGLGSMTDRAAHVELKARFSAAPGQVAITDRLEPLSAYSARAMVLGLVAKGTEYVFDVVPFAFDLAAGDWAHTTSYYGLVFGVGTSPSRTAPFTIHASTPGAATAGSTVLGGPALFELVPAWDQNLYRLSVPSPTIEHNTPAWIATGAPATVMITGTGFTRSTIFELVDWSNNCDLDGFAPCGSARAPASTISYLSATQAIIEVPAFDADHTGYYDVFATHDLPGAYGYGTSVWLSSWSPDALVVTDHPFSLASASPTSGPTTGGTLVTITGSFGAMTAADFGSGSITVAGYWVGGLDLVEVRPDALVLRMPDASQSVPAGGLASLELCNADWLCTRLNDFFEYTSSCPVDAELGSTLGQLVAASTTGLVDADRGSCGGGGGERRYRWSAPHDGTFTFDTLGSTFDTVLYVRDGACDGAELACNDDSSGLQSRVDVSLVAGQTVVVWVDAYGAGDAGDFVLNVTEASSPTDGGVPDDGGSPAVCWSRELGGAIGQVASGVLASSAGTTAGSCAGGGAEDVLLWTAPRAGEYTLDTFGSSFDTVLYVRDGACDGAELACNDDASGLQSSVTLTLAAGQVLVVYVDAYGSGAAGSWVLNVTPPPCETGLTVDTTCDGVDDDCDGLVDDDYVGTPVFCGNGQCQARGTTGCASGQIVSVCTPLPAPSIDDATCDATDDDCDGRLDEEFTAPAGFECSDGYVIVAGCRRTPGPRVDTSCNGTDDDCDGLVDEDCDLPPDPQASAPVLDVAEPPRMSDAVSFLYDGPNAVQVGVAPEAIDE
ncbi:hypothetical protein L6R52_37050, partial [Myxococcota bacterium]|nr:hypothetical protein [Myxococcota bacterium]